MEMALTIAQSGLGTAEALLRRMAAREKDAKAKKRNLELAAALKAANTGITEYLIARAEAEAEVK